MMSKEADFLGTFDAAEGMFEAARRVYARGRRNPCLLAAAAF